MGLLSYKSISVLGMSFVCDIIERHHDVAEEEEEEKEGVRRRGRVIYTGK